MAKAMKCDRCGNFYENHHMRYRDDHINGIHVTNTDKGGRYSLIRIVDLCPKCCRELIDWIGVEEEEE